MRYGLMSICRYSCTPIGSVLPTSTCVASCSIAFSILSAVVVAFEFGDVGQDFPDPFPHLPLAVFAKVFRHQSLACFACKPVDILPRGLKLPLSLSRLFKAGIFSRFGFAVWRDGQGVPCVRPIAETRSWH